MLNGTRAGQAPCPNMLEPVTGSEEVHTVALKGAAIRGDNHEHQDYRLSVRMNSDSPSSLWSWQAETMHFGDKRPAEHKQPAQLYYNIICNTGTGTKDT